MEVAKEQLEGNKVELKVEVEQERVNEALQQAYKKVVKEVNIPGFRKGKVPRKILEARYGKEVLYHDAFDFLVPAAYSQAVKAAEIEPIDQPEISEFKISPDQPATFTAIVEVKPEVELGQYTDLGIEKKEAELSEEELENQLKAYQEQHSQLEHTEREVVADKDFVIIDFEGFIDGKQFPGGSGEEYTLEIGSGTFIPNFEEQLIGQKVGEEVELNLTFPENYQTEDLAGQDVLFRVKIKEIKEKKLPELNDEFAKEVSDFESLEQFKADLKEKMLEQKKQQLQQQLENELIKKVSENTTVDIPTPLVNNELDMMYHNLAYSISRQGINIDDYFKHINSSKEDWQEQNREHATERAKNNLVLESIAKKEGIKVSDEEIDKSVEGMADNSEHSAEDIKKLLMIQGQLDGLVHSMLIKKVMEFLVENN
ncbi:MAG: trigger factor [Halanaerobiales bacterium]|nr:trigger factor [Halanaerobiales bacterium]